MFISYLPYLILTNLFYRILLIFNQFLLFKLLVMFAVIMFYFFQFYFFDALLWIKYTFLIFSLWISTRLYIIFCLFDSILLRSKIMNNCLFLFLLFLYLFLIQTVIFLVIFQLLIILITGRLNTRAHLY